MLIARVAGPDRLGHYETVFKGQRFAFPGWNDPASVEAEIAEWVRKDGNLALGIAGWTIPNSRRMPRILTGTPIAALEADGFLLAVAKRIDAAHMGLDATGFDISCTRYEISIQHDARVASLRTAVNLRGALASTISNLRRAAVADRLAACAPVAWTAFATQVAGSIADDRRTALRAEIDGFWHAQRTGKGADSFSRVVQAPSIPHARSVRFKVTRRGGVQATVAFEGFSLSETTLCVKGAYPDAYVAALPGRAADQVVDHPMTRGRIVDRVHVDHAGIILTLAA